MKVCPECRREFFPKSNRQRFCRPEHRLAWAARIHPIRYGADHRKLRRQLERVVAAGLATCSRCREPILAGEPWDLDHADDGASYLGPAHSDCNRDTAGKVRLPNSDPANTVAQWSRHWYGPANPRCPRCRQHGGPCEAAEAA
jgi:hypothetical protein